MPNTELTIKQYSQMRYLKDETRSIFEAAM